MVFVAAGWNRLCLALCLATEWKSKAPRKKLEADTHADEEISRFCMATSDTPKMACT